MAINDVYRVAAKLETLVGSDEQVNVFYWQWVAGTGQEADVLLEMDARLGALYSAINDHVTDGLRYVGAEIDNLTQDSKVGFIDDWASAIGTGGANDEPLPVQCTALVLGLTAKLRVQGRKYLPLFTEAASVGGSWSGAVLIALQDFLDLWVAAFLGNQGNTYQPGTQNFGTGGTLGPFNPFIGSKVINQPRTQKSRYFGKGS